MLKNINFRFNVFLLSTVCFICFNDIFDHIVIVQDTDQTHVPAITFVKNI